MKTFKNAVHTRDFAVTAEIFLRPESDAESIRHQAEVLRDHVDAILLTDNQFGQVHMSTLVAASILMACGVDAIVQLSSRNRNRIALLSDLLGAAALGISSLLLVRGERRGTTTEVVISNLEVNPPIDDHVFSVAALAQERRLPEPKR